MLPTTTIRHCPEFFCSLLLFLLCVIGPSRKTQSFSDFWSYQVSKVITYTAKHSTDLHSLSGGTTRGNRVLQQPWETILQRMVAGLYTFYFWCPVVSEAWQPWAAVTAAGNGSDGCCTPGFTARPHAELLLKQPNLQTASCSQHFFNFSFAWYSFSDLAFHPIIRDSLFLPPLCVM